MTRRCRETGSTPIQNLGSNSISLPKPPESSKKIVTVQLSVSLTRLVWVGGKSLGYGSRRGRCGLARRRGGEDWGRRGRCAGSARLVGCRDVAARLARRHARRAPVGAPQRYKPSHASNDCRVWARSEPKRDDRSPAGQLRDVVDVSDTRRDVLRRLPSATFGCSDAPITRALGWLRARSPPSRWRLTRRRRARARGANVPEGTDD
jgi:hypothetical protein